jgi:hypothetical protein
MWMIDLIYLPLIIFFGLAVPILILFVYASYFDWKNPPEPIRYTWHNIWPDYKGEWERGHATKVYYNPKTHDIRGKVVMQKDGLYLATMYNGEDKEFMLDSLAQKWVEQYKSRIYK